MAPDPRLLGGKVWPRLPPLSTQSCSQEGAVVLSGQEATDPAIPSCHSPVTRHVWLPSSWRSLQPEERLNRPLVPQTAKGKQARGQGI